MGSFADRVRTLALALGGPGLFLIGFLDSSFISLPEINDLLLIWMVTQHKGRVLYYVACSTLGSIAGCLILYHIGRKGDEWITRRFSAARVERALGTFQRYGVMAVLIPSILPPPAPFKIFVLLAGLAGISTGRFVAAIAIGRGFRYLVEGLLAVEYGDQAIDFINNNGRPVALVLVGIIAVGFAGYLLWRWLARRKTPVN